MLAALTLLAAVTLVAWIELLVDATRGRAQMCLLRRVEPPSGAVRAALPSVSVVVAARNEERRIAEAVGSMLALDYPHLEVVVVDDRSDDDTGRILDRLSVNEERLRVIHLVELPVGWLGKNHALQVGAEVATGKLLLFTDADVIFEPTALSRAVRWMTEREVDHLAGATDVHTTGIWLTVFISAFALFFNAYFRPWRATRSSPRWYIGFGGFNLVRRSAYERIGGHAALPLDPLDDVNLGRLLKQGGARQQCAVLGGLTSVEWYPSLGAAIRGLEKNTMAAVGWSFGLLVLGVLAQIAMTVWPFIAVFVTEGTPWWLNLAAVAVIVVLHAALLSQTSLPAWAALSLPVGVLLIAYTYLRAAFLTYRRGGIEWRGTFYPLADLRGSGHRRP